MEDVTHYEKQIEGVNILLNNDHTQYFQLFAATTDGPVMLSGQHQDTSFDAGQFLGQQIQVIAEQTDMSYEEVAEYGVQEAKPSRRSHQTMNGYRNRCRGLYREHYSIVLRDPSGDVVDKTGSGWLTQEEF